MPFTLAAALVPKRRWSSRYAAAVKINVIFSLKVVMSDFTACIFPQTIPDRTIFFPLVHVFPSLVYLQAVENDPEQIGKDRPWIQDLVERQRLRFFCPAPLEEDRDRFLSLIADLQYRRDDYLSQLSSLALSNLTAADQEESRFTIIGHLNANRKDQDTAAAKLLWQARLVLKLGELLDKEQAELDRHLALIASKQDQLLQELREESGTPFSRTRQMSEQQSASDGMLPLRLKAWAQLYTLGTVPLPEDCRFFITPRGEGIEQLLEQCTEVLADSPQQPVVLDLPGAVSASKENGMEKTLLRQEPNSHLLALCAQLLTQNCSAMEIASHLDHWQEHLASTYPAGEYGRSRLTLYSCPTLNAIHLFKDSFADTSLPVGQRDQAPGGCVLGFLETAD